MAWSGGSFTRANPTWVSDANNLIGIEAGRHDAQDNDFTTGINQCLNKDGSNSATGNLNLGGFRYTNSAAATARTDLAQVAQVQDGDYIWLGTTGGTATAQTATASPAITAYKAGQKFRAKIGASLGSTGTVTTAHTINVNSVGAKNIVNQDGTNPTAGTWVAGAIIELIYDGTNFVIVNDPGGWQTLAPTISGSGSMTVSSQSNAMAEYRKSGKIVTLLWDISFSLGGTAAQAVNSTAPVNSAVGSTATGQVLFGIPFLTNGGATGLGQNYFTTASNIVFYTNTSASPPNWSTGSTSIRLSWSYRSV